MEVGNTASLSLAHWDLSRQGAVALSSSSRSIRASDFNLEECP
jgi:hypothetical protein